MSMSPRERVLAALNREEPDRVPHCELFVDVAMAEELLGWPRSGGATAGTARKNPYTADQAKAVAARLGHDNIGFILRAPHYAEAIFGKDGRTFVGPGRIKTEADLAMIDLPDPTRDEFYRDAEEFLRRRGDYACHLSTRIGLSQAMLSLGIERFCLLLYDDRAFVEKLLDIYFDWTALMAERACQLGFDIFWTTDDFAFKTGLMFSPRMFRELLAPRYKRVLDKVTIPWVLHSDGNIAQSLDILLELGVRAVHPVEKGAMDIRALKRDYGDRICVMGNVDLVLLGRGSPEEVDQEVRELIRDLGPGGGYVITSGNSLASYLKPECVLAMAEAVRKYGAYPIDLA